MKIDDIRQQLCCLLYEIVLFAGKCSTNENLIEVEENIIKIELALIEIKKMLIEAKRREL